MISFEPTEEQTLMMAAVVELARTALRPKAREAERSRGFPGSLCATARDLGLGAALVPEALGGAGLGLTTAVLLEEELAWGDASAPFALGGPGAFGLAVLELGTAAQARDALAPFFGDGAAARFGAVAWGEAKPHPDRAGMQTTATPNDGGFRLDGAKAYVIGAELASSFVVFAQIDPALGWSGIGAFLVERGAPGLSVLERATTLGLDAVSFGGLRLEGVQVPASARLDGGEGGFLPSVYRFFAKNALLVAARGVGLSRAAFELTREYVDNRKAFGKPIGHFQAVAFTLADRAMDVDAGRALVWRAAAAWDALPGLEPAERPAAERHAMLLSAQAIACVHEGAMRCGDDGVQLHGGAGFMRDYLVEKMMRDAKQLALCGLSSGQADQLAAAIALGVPIDPALVLPTPETQNVFV
jgi:acyl-CoA dehydrogenase